MPMQPNESYTESINLYGSHINKPKNMIMPSKTIVYSFPNVCSNVCINALIPA